MRKNRNVLTIAAHSVIRSLDPAVIRQGIALIELKAQVSASVKYFFSFRMHVLCSLSGLVDAHSP